MTKLLPLALIGAALNEGCASIDYVVHDDTKPETVDTGGGDTDVTTDTGETGDTIDQVIPTILIDKASLVQNCLSPNPEAYAFRGEDNSIDPESLSLLQARLDLRTQEILNLINASSGCEGTTEEMLSTGDLPASCDVFLVSAKEDYPNDGVSWGTEDGECKIDGEKTGLYAFFGQEAYDFLAMESDLDSLYGVSCESTRIDSLIDGVSTLAPMYVSFGTGSLGSPTLWSCGHNGYADIWDYSRYDESSAGENCHLADTLGEEAGAVHINFEATCESDSTECNASTTQNSMDEAANWLVNTSDELLAVNPNEDFRCWGRLGFAQIDLE